MNKTSDRKTSDFFQKSYMYCVRQWLGESGNKGFGSFLHSSLDAEGGEAVVRYALQDLLALRGEHSASEAESAHSAACELRAVAASAAAVTALLVAIRDCRRRAALCDLVCQWHADGPLPVDAAAPDP